MRILLMLFIVALCAGCATDPDGRKLGFGETLQKWEDSMTNTEARLQNKNYSN